ncbi:galactose-6-phosphate isomerase subunit LacB [Sebaldella sp. S0638]|uniref:galactose-6-phosphate isomerase subunit LacB n=1 Tax=Sebaldella sp. S0638 TaxID=2957809 RepID=UPI00209D5F77|nr:galactose-6-phosphate isomerase subunit LacB [Sebaldella sp. S0638]MCP1222788.1 galactose-6-phosphate isomerase subunit LacB [Sebaldella sp. S0638]
MKISIGCDHIVTDIKNEMVKYLEEKGHEVFDEGTYDNERTHYPIYGRKVGLRVLKKEADFGIVICGTGVGISNAASKVPGIRLSLVRDVLAAKMARKKYDANVLGLGGRITGIGLIQNIMDEFLGTEYEKNEENENLINKINNLKIENEEIKKEDFFDEFIEKWNQGCYHD